MDDEGIYINTHTVYTKPFIHSHFIAHIITKYNILRVCIHIHCLTYLRPTFLFTIDEFSYDHYYSNLLFIMTYRHIGTIIITKYVQNVVELEASARSNWTTLLCCTRFGSLCSLFRTKRLMLCVARCVYRIKKRFDLNNKKFFFSAIRLMR